MGARAASEVGGFGKRGPAANRCAAMIPMDRRCAVLSADHPGATGVGFPKPTEAAEQPAGRSARSAAN